MQKIVPFLCAIVLKKIILISEKIPMHIIVAASTWISRIIIAAVQIFNVRILIESLGSQSYAIFIFYASLAPWFALGDLGIGPSLQNFISEQRATKGNYNQYIYSAFAISGIMFFFLSCLLYFATPYIVDYLLKNILAMAYAEKVQSFFIVSIIMLGTAVGSIAYRIWYAQQKGYLASIIPAIASIIGFVGIWLVSKSIYSHSLIINLIVFFTPGMLLSLIAFIFQVFSLKKIKFQYDSVICKKIIKRASGFFVFSAMAVVTLQIDYIIMLQFLSSNDIIIYNICMKIFGMISMLYIAVLGALSPVFTELIVCHEWKKVLNYIKKYLIIGGSLITILMIGIVIFLPSIFHFLAPKEQFIVPISFILLVGLNQMVVFWVSIFSTILQSMSYIRFFLWTTPIQMIISAVLQWNLTQSYGIYGIVIGIMISYIVVAAWLLPYKVYKKANLFIGGN